MGGLPHRRSVGKVEKQPSNKLSSQKDGGSGAKVGPAGRPSSGRPHDQFIMSDMSVGILAQVPDLLSPTRPSVSPGCRSMLRPDTACSFSDGVHGHAFWGRTSNVTDRSRTESIGSDICHLRQLRVTRAQAIIANRFFCGFRGDADVFRDLAARRKRAALGQV